MKGVHTGPDEGLDPQILFDRFEEDLYLPPVLVDGRDGGAAKSQVIGQENDDVLVLFIPHFNAPQSLSWQSASRGSCHR